MIGEYQTVVELGLAGVSRRNCENTCPNTHFVHQECDMKSPGLELEALVVETFT
jgi:hypothetical protein